MVEGPTDFDGSLSEDALPLVFFFGSVSANDNLDLYRHLVSRLAAVLDQRSQVLHPSHVLPCAVPMNLMLLRARMFICVLCCCPLVLLLGHK